MKFCEREIEMAQKLHALNLQWHPQAGNYVFDIKGIIEKSSPFQTGVYFILDIKGLNVLAAFVGRLPKYIKKP
ncbi:MAG: hypothetical protein ACYSO2_01930 [Planctomycetota bacterium]|jgi:hypothetical protein